MTSIDREALQGALDALDELLCGNALDGELWHEANNLYHKLERLAEDTDTDEDEGDAEDEGLTFHILDQENGEQLAECILQDGIAALYDGATDYGTETMHEVEGEALYKEIIDFAAFALGVGHSDIYLTDEDETRILRAE